MKKLWKMRKNREAVSPVIATILMVAITVVLAAVLYVMVMGFGGTSAQTPTGSFTGTPANQTAGYQYTFGVLSPETKFIDCKVIVGIDGVMGTAVALTASGSVAVSGGSPTHAFAVTVNDLASDGKISQGDNLVLVYHGNFAVSHTYTVSIIFTTTGGQICSQTLSL